MRIHCFGIVIDNITLDEAIAETERWLEENNQHYVVTPNPEMVMLAKTDASFAESLQKSSMALPDGFGLIIAGKLLGLNIRERVAGTDYFEHVLANLPPKTSFYFLGATPRVGKRATEIAKKRFNTNIVGYFSPRFGTYNFANHILITDLVEHRRIIDSINSVKPQILIVALGHGQQEKWMEKFLSEIPSVKVAIGVGGALDFLSGFVLRAPKFLRIIGLEWLWRMITQPKRWKRIWTAVVLFPIEAIKWAISIKYRYRPNVVGCVLNNQGQVLIVERKDEKNHWQFPQGGINLNENYETAILRELKEEIGTDKLQVLKCGKYDSYTYSWSKQSKPPKQVTHLKRKYGYKGQKQTVVYLIFNGNSEDIVLDNEELIDWRWVNKNELLNAVHRVRRPLAKIILDELNKYGY